jgi:hypothetical protein
MMFTAKESENGKVSHGKNRNGMENGKVYLLAIDKAGLKSALLGSQKAFFIFLDASIACVSEIK